MINFFKKKKSINRYEISRKEGEGEVKFRLNYSKLNFQCHIEYTSIQSFFKLLIISQTGNVLVNVVSIN